MDAMNADIKRAIEEATQAAVNKKWNEHMDAMKPKLITSHILSFAVGLGSGMTLQKLFAGPKL